jgi:hypothetical protein
MLLLSAKSLLILLLICVCCEGFVLSKIDVNARLQQTKNEKDLEGIRGLKGYYRRPSRAIEKGGGFFVPGLEGEKIRIVSAAFLIVSTGVLCSYFYPCMSSLLFSRPRLH